jgi:hypothetical protein
MKRRSWTLEELKIAIKVSTSYRQVLKRIHLRASGGNYSQLHKYIKNYCFDVSHFKGKAWNKGLKGLSSPKIPLAKILIRGSVFQSYKLKARLFSAGIKKPKCEICGWDKSVDGRIPVELDHINGDRNDNRITNLRILCPNCHSLQRTHQGLNRKG